MRARQMLALVEGGHLELMGPHVSFSEQRDGRFVATSEAVDDFRVDVDVLIDAYVPAPHVDFDENPVIRSMADVGLLRSFMGTGGIEVTPKTFHPVTKDGQIKDCIHVLGIPTEAARWFLHVGLIEPGVWDEFIDDADAVAEAAIQRLLPAEAGWGASGVSGRYADPHKYLS